MAESKINSPGAMVVGDSAATTSVTLGKTGAVSISNSTTPPTITVAGTVTGSLDSKSYYISVRDVAGPITLPDGNPPTPVPFVAVDQPATNFPFTLGTSAFTIPAAGTYSWNAKCTVTLPGGGDTADIGFLIGGENPTTLFGLAQFSVFGFGSFNRIQAIMTRKFTAGATVQVAVRRYDPFATCTIDNGGLPLDISVTAYRMGP